MNQTVHIYKGNNPILHRIIGKYNLPHIWDQVLNNTVELKVKNH